MTAIRYYHRANPYLCLLKLSLYKPIYRLRKAYCRPIIDVFDYDYRSYTTSHSSENREISLPRGINENCSYQLGRCVAHHCNCMAPLPFLNDLYSVLFSTTHFVGERGNVVIAAFICVHACVFMCVRRNDSPLCKML